MYFSLYNINVHITYTPSLTWQQQAGSRRAPFAWTLLGRLEIRLEHDIAPFPTPPTPPTSRVATCVQHMSVESHRVVKVESCNDISNLRTMTK